MDSLDPASPVALASHASVGRPPQIWKFWGTALWGLVIFGAMFAGQMAVVAWFVLREEGPPDIAAAIHVLGGGLTISLSVIMGLPAVLAALWLAIRLSRTPFADYLALRGTTWTNLLIGIGALVVLVLGWDQLSRATGHDATPASQTQPRPPGRRSVAITHGRSCRPENRRRRGARAYESGHGVCDSPW